MTDNELIIERLIFFAKQKAGSISDFEKEVGIKNGYIKSIKQKKSAMGVDKLVQIYTRYPDIDMIWLLLGDNKSTDVQENYTNYETNDTNAEKIKHLESLIVEKERFIQFLINNQKQ